MDNRSPETVRVLGTNVHSDHGPEHQRLLEEIVERQKLKRKRTEQWKMREDEDPSQFEHNYSFNLAKVKREINEYAQQAKEQHHEVQQLNTVFKAVEACTAILANEETGSSSGESADQTHNKDTMSFENESILNGEYDPNLPITKEVMDQVNQGCQDGQKEGSDGIPETPEQQPAHMDTTTGTSIQDMQAEMWATLNDLGDQQKKVASDIAELKQVANNIASTMQHIYSSQAKIEAEIPLMKENILKLISCVPPPPAPEQNQRQAQQPRQAPPQQQQHQGQQFQGQQDQDYRVAQASTSRDDTHRYRQAFGQIEEVVANLPSDGQCLFCPGHHVSDTCAQVVSLAERRQICMAKRHCPVCILGHKGDCQVRKGTNPVVCRWCRAIQEHHSSLCDCEAHVAYLAKLAQFAARH